MHEIVDESLSSVLIYFPVDEYSEWFLLDAIANNVGTTTFGHDSSCAHIHFFSIEHMPRNGNARLRR